MDKLKALGRGTQLMTVSAVLLLLVSFLRWQEIEIGPISAGVSAWDDFLGILMGILTIVLIARVAARLAAVEIPIPLSFATTSFVLGVLIAVLAVLKNLTDDYSTFWSYVGVVLAVLVAVGAWLEVQEAGGMEMMRNEASSLGGGAGAATATTPAAADEVAVPPAAPEPMTPMPAESPSAPTGEVAADPEPASDAVDEASDASDEAAEESQDGPSTGAST